MNPFPLADELPHEPDYRASETGDYVVERIVTTNGPALWRVGLLLGAGIGTGLAVVLATSWLVGLAIVWGLK